MRRGPYITTIVMVSKLYKNTDTRNRCTRTIEVFTDPHNSPKFYEQNSEQFTPCSLNILYNNTVFLIFLSTEIYLICIGFVFKLQLKHCCKETQNKSITTLNKFIWFKLIYFDIEVLYSRISWLSLTVQNIVIIYWVCHKCLACISLPWPEQTTPFH